MPPQPVRTPPAKTTCASSCPAGSLCYMDFDSILDKTFGRLAGFHFPAALESRDVAIWSDDHEVQGKIANRLGWVEAVDFARSQIEHVQRAAAAARRDGFTDVLLLGMGGSSLAPE